MPREKTERLELEAHYSVFTLALRAAIPERFSVWTLDSGAGVRTLGEAHAGTCFAGGDARTRARQRGTARFVCMHREGRVDTGEAQKTRRARKGRIAGKGCRVSSVPHSRNALAALWGASVRMVEPDWRAGRRTGLLGGGGLRGMTMGDGRLGTEGEAVVGR